MAGFTLIEYSDVLSMINSKSAFSIYGRRCINMLMRALPGTRDMGNVIMHDWLENLDSQYIAALTTTSSILLP